MTAACRQRRIAARDLDDLDCAICSKLLYQPVTTPCGHSMCRECLSRCLDHNPRCPVCRTVRAVGGGGGGGGGRVQGRLWQLLRGGCSGKGGGELLRAAGLCAQAWVVRRSGHHCLRVFTPTHPTPPPPHPPSGLQVLHVGQDLHVSVVLKNIIARSFPEEYLEREEEAGAAATTGQAEPERWVQGGRGGGLANTGGRCSHHEAGRAPAGEAEGNAVEGGLGVRAAPRAKGRPRCRLTPCTAAAGRRAARTRCRCS